jgi:N6-adenosine-specific RNA methylase IME4
MKILKQTSDNIPSVVAAFKALDRLEFYIRNSNSFNFLDSAANIAAGLQRKYKPVKEVADRAGEVWTEAEAQLGIELEKQPKAKGAAGGGKKTRSRGPIVELRDKTPTLAEMGIDRKRAARAKRIASLPVQKRKKYIAELKMEGKGVTPNAILAKSRQENKTTKKHAVATAVFSTDGPYDCIVIDPPWDIKKIDRDVRPNQDAFDYPTMSDEKIASFWAENIAARMKPDCHVFMWTTQKKLPVSINLLRQLNLRYVLTMVWHKPGGFQPIDLPQYNCEFVVYARHGVPIFIDTKSFNCCFSAPSREHSRKPAYFYDLIRRVTGGSRIDIFSREQHEGFAQFGNEITRFQGPHDA